jgi:hypothetical protein
MFFNKKLLVLSLLTTANLVFFYPNKTLADGFNLTKPNAAPCTSQSLGLNNENVCSDKISLENATGINIYYDFGSIQDQYLPKNQTITWTLSGSNRSSRVVVIDEDINIPGIQEKKYNVFSGKNYIFRLVNDRIILYQKR